MSNKTDLQRNNVILGDTPNGLIGGVSRIESALEKKNVPVEKAGTYATFYELETAINDKVTDTYDADATANDIASGKTAYVNGKKITGEYEPLDVSDTTATAGDVGKGKIFYNKDGVRTEGVGNISAEIGIDMIALPEDIKWTSSTNWEEAFPTTIYGDYFCTGPGGRLYKLDKKNKQFIPLTTNTVGKVKYFKFPNEDILFYYVTTKEKPIYFNAQTKEITYLDYPTNTTSFSYMFEYNNRYFLFGENYFYEFIQEDLTFISRSDRLSASFGSYNFEQVYSNENSLLVVYGYSGYLAYYDFEQNKLIELGGLNNKTNAFYSKSGNLYLYSRYSSYKGLLMFDNKTKTLITLFDDGYNYTKYFNTSDNIVYIITSQDYTKVIRYDENTNTITEIEFSAGNSQGFYETDDGTVYTYSGKSANAGLYYYDTNTNSFVLISGTEGSYSFSLTEFDNVLYFSSTVNNLLGFYVVNSDKTIRQLINTGYNKYCLIKDDTYGTFFTWQTSTYKGLYLKKINEEDFSLIYDSCYYMNMLYKSSKNELFLTTNYSGAKNVLYIDSEYNVTKLAETHYTQFIEYNDSIFFCDRSNLYDYAREYVSGIICRYKNGVVTTFKQIGHNPYLFIENGKLYFTNTAFSYKFVYSDEIDDFVSTGEYARNGVYYKGIFIDNFISDNKLGICFDKSGNIKNFVGGLKPFGELNLDSIGQELVMAYQIFNHPNPDNPNLSDMQTLIYFTE